MHHHAKPKLFKFARKNREKATEAEALLWEALKRTGSVPYKFRRQHPIGKYILDFYCHAQRLSIELDGDYHLSPEQQLYDEQRTADLNQLGIQEIRFTNQEVLNHLVGVLDKIKTALQKE